MTVGIRHTDLLDAEHGVQKRALEGLPPHLKEAQLLILKEYTTISTNAQGEEKRRKQRASLLFMPKI